MEAPPKKRQFCSFGGKSHDLFRIPPNEVIMNASLFQQDDLNHPGNPWGYTDESGQEMNYLDAYLSIEQQQKEMTEEN